VQHELMVGHKMQEQLVGSLRLINRIKGQLFFYSLSEGKAFLCEGLHIL
jgi:hypothetical protein